MLEYGGEYFKLETFPDGEAKAELLKVRNNRVGNRVDEDPGFTEKRKKEKRKVVASDPTAGRKPVPGPSTAYTTTYQ